MLQVVFNIYRVRCFFLAPIFFGLLGCGFEFNRTFDSDKNIQSTERLSTDSLSTDSKETDSDSDYAQIPDFTIVGFATVDEITMGGKGGTIAEPLNSAELKEYLLNDAPLIIRINSIIELSERLDVSSNKTIEGVGSNTGITGAGLRLTGVNNIIIRNLKFYGSVEDALSIENNAHHIWIDHNDFSNSQDGLVDIKTGASYITISWNRFSSQNMVCLIGASDNHSETDSGKLRITLHHNWFDNTTQQHPRCRFGEVHIFNNFYDNIEDSGYAIASTTDAKVLSEANYFLNISRPFSLTEGSSSSGNLVSIDDVFINCGESITDGEVFDPHYYYDYQLHPADSVDNIVKMYSGVGIILIDDL